MGQLDRAVLKLVTEGKPYSLSVSQITLIGRDPACQVHLDSSNPKYRGVSRRHAEIHPQILPSGSIQWQICDLNSANGTYLNGRQLKTCEVLQTGDRLRLDTEGPEFIFEIETPKAPVVPAVNRRPQPQPLDTALHLSQILPVMSTGRDLLKKAYLIPGIATVVLVVLLFTADTGLVCKTPFLNPFGLETSCYNLILGSYLCLGVMYVTYQLCGKVKAWWILFAAALLTMIIVNTHWLFGLLTFVFRKLPPGVSEITTQIIKGENVGFIKSFFAMFFAAGLAEEFVKAIPLFGAIYLAKRIKTPWREQVGIWEPLDGILLGVASGIGFTYIETLGEYVNRPLNNILEQAVSRGLCEVVNQSLQCSEGVKELILAQGQFQGLILVVPRILGAVAGHAAWSGYLGYFIGLSILKPSRRWQMLGIGYLTSAIVHALWNSAADLFPGNVQAQTIVQTLIGVISYVFLVAAILKARQLSPTRSQNFATRMFKIPP